MKKLSLLFALLGVLALVGSAAAADTASTGYSENTTIINNPTPDDICPGAVYKCNDDGSFENGYAWAYAGVVTPYYGAWAEGYTLDAGQTMVCGMQFFLTQVGAQAGQTMDVYVWDDAGSNPNNVISVLVGVTPGTIAMWPAISGHDVDITDVVVPANYFIGWWPNWPGTGNGWYVASDENGFGGGIPRTNIAPGIGYPTGWNNPNVVSTFAGCMDLGICTYEVGGGTPAQENTWGAIKALYN